MQRKSRHSPVSPSDLVVIRGAGEMATGVAVVLFQRGWRKLLLTEIPWPKAVRRRVCFSEAVFDGGATVEGLTSRRIESADNMDRIWASGEVPLIIDPELEVARALAPAVIIDATLRKRVADFRRELAPLTIALGPGFAAGMDAHVVIETQRGPSLGRVIRAGEALANTGVPFPVGGHSEDRVLRAPRAGIFRTHLSIGHAVSFGERIGESWPDPGRDEGVIAIRAQLDGVLRGLLRDGTPVEFDEKVGDIDPSENSAPLDEISDKARRIGEGVAEAMRI